MRLWPAFAAFLIGALALGSSGLNPKEILAEGIEVRSQSVQNRFPEGLQFTLFVAAGGEISDARLHYRLTPQTTEGQVKATCTPGTTSNCTATVGGTRASYLVPGANVEYWWDLRDAAGNSLTTERAQTQYMDTRFQWESKTDGKVTAYYHAGTDQSVTSILQAANESVNRMSALLKTDIDFQIKVWVYENARELQQAAAPDSQATGGILEGQVVAADTALVSKDSSTLDTVRHELTHVVVDRASRGFIVPVPTWVNEGLAVYSQRSYSPGWQEALDLAIRRNLPLPIESLGDSTRSNADFSLFYAESGALVRFLVETYGDEKFGQFFAGLRSDTLNGSLKKVYGFDQFGLEDAWRKSVGLPTASAGSNPAPTAAAGNQNQSASAPTPSTSRDQAVRGSGGGSSDLLIILVAAVTAAVALGLLGAGVYFARKQT
jgi:hypothetical protein